MSPDSGHLGGHWHRRPFSRTDHSVINPRVSHRTSRCSKDRAGKSWPDACEVQNLSRIYCQVSKSFLHSQSSPSIHHGSQFKAERPRHHSLPRMEAKRRLRLVTFRHQTRAASPSLRHYLHGRSRKSTDSTDRENPLHLSCIQVLPFFARTQNRRLLSHRATLHLRGPHARSERELE